MLPDANNEGKMTLFTTHRITLMLLVILLILTGCSSRTTPEIEATETITSTLTLAKTSSPTKDSTETFAKAVTLTSLPTETINPTIAQTQGELAPLPDPLFAIAYIYKDSLRIECVETECLREINLGNAAPFEKPYKLGSVYYLNPGSMFITLYAPRMNPNEDKWAIIHINPETGEAKDVNISPEHRMFVRDIAHDRLVLVPDGEEKVIIVQEDLSVIEVDLGAEIFQFIEADDHIVIAVNDQPVEQDGQTFIETFAIDVRSGEFTRKLVKSPAFANWLYLPEGESTDDTLAAHLLTVSADYTYVYLYYSQGEGDEFHKLLGKFDTTSLEEVSSVVDPEFLRISTNAHLYSQQYRNVSYPRAVPIMRESAAEGLFAPVDLTTLEALLERRNFFIAPFGDHLAIGTKNSVMLLSFDGKIAAEYPLPYNSGLTYRLIEYKTKKIDPSPDCLGDCSGLTTGAFRCLSKRFHIHHLPLLPSLLRRERQQVALHRVARPYDPTRLPAHGPYKSTHQTKIPTPVPASLHLIGKIQPLAIPTAVIDHFQICAIKTELSQQRGLRSIDANRAPLFEGMTVHG